MPMPAATACLMLGRARTSLAGPINPLRPRLLHKRFGLEEPVSRTTNGCWQNCSASHAGDRRGWQGGEIATSRSSGLMRWLQVPAEPLNDSVKPRSRSPSKRRRSTAMGCRSLPSGDRNSGYVSRNGQRALGADRRPASCLRKSQSPGAGRRIKQGIFRLGFDREKPLGVTRQQFAGLGGRDFAPRQTVEKLTLSSARIPRLLRRRPVG